jgi:hypothetical protein
VPNIESRCNQLKLGHPPPLRDSKVLSWLNHYSFPLAYAAIFVGILGGALVFCGRGAARIQVAVAGFLLALMSLFMLWAYSLD